MPTTLKPLSQSEFLVTISDVKGFWTKASGLEEKFESTEYSDGISKRMKKIRGMSQIDDLKLEKPFDPVFDEALLTFCQEYCDMETEITVTIQPIKRCGEIRQYGNKKLTLLGCKIILIKGFEVDTKGKDVSMLELHLSIDDWAWA